MCNYERFEKAVKNTNFRSNFYYYICGRPGFDSWVRKIPWMRAWQPTPVSLPEESPWIEEPGGLQSMGRRDSGITE